MQGAAKGLRKGQRAKKRVNFYPQLRPTLERSREGASTAQIFELRQLAGLRQVPLKGLVLDKYGVRSPQWLSKAQAKSLIKELRDGTDHS